jgi:hypothetical protein
MRRALTTLASLALLAPTALRAATPDCADTADPRACRLGELLTWLHFTAAVLVVVLLAVVVIVLQIIRRTRRAADPLATKTRRPNPPEDLR